MLSLTALLAHKWHLHFFVGAGLLFFGDRARVQIQILFLIILNIAVGKEIWDVFHKDVYPVLDGIGDIFFTILPVLILLLVAIHRRRS